MDNSLKTPLTNPDKAHDKRTVLSACHSGGSPAGAVLSRIEIVGAARRSHNQLGLAY